MGENYLNHSFYVTYSEKCDVSLKFLSAFDVDTAVFDPNGWSFDSSHFLESEGFDEEIPSQCLNLAYDLLRKIKSHQLPGPWLDLSIVFSFLSFKLSDIFC